MRVALYQINSDRDTFNTKFMSWRWRTDHDYINWYKLPEREDIPNVKDKDKGKITTVSAFCEKYSEQESSASRERE